jgi:hypothetical protein
MGKHRKREDAAAAAENGQSQEGQQHARAEAQCGGVPDALGTCCQRFQGIACGKLRSSRTTLQNVSCKTRAVFFEDYDQRSRPCQIGLTCAAALKDL